MELIILKLSIRKIAGDIAEDDAIRDEWYLNPIIIILVIALLELPLTLFKKIEKLKIFSFLGVAGIVLFMVCIVIDFIIKVADGQETEPMDIWP